MSARSFAAIILAAGVIAIAGYYAAGAAVPTATPGLLAELQRIDQAGFPEQLYKLLIPADNPQSDAKIALGKALFLEPRLSLDNAVAWSHRHDPVKGFADQMPTSIGVHGQFGKRNAPTILNSIFNRRSCVSFASAATFSSSKSESRPAAAARA
jgi:cytochrome c peroxidase